MVEHNNKQRRAVDSIKRFEYRSLWSDVAFEKEVIKAKENDSDAIGDIGSKRPVIHFVLDSI